MSEESFYERCLKKFTALMEDAREQGDYPLFRKWEVEVKNYQALVDLENEEREGRLKDLPQ